MRRQRADDLLSIREGCRAIDVERRADVAFDDFWKGVTPSAASQMSAAVPFNANNVESRPT
jgi:hypothetical protein